MKYHGAIIDERLMTDHEYAYAKKVVAGHRYLFWFLMGSGVITFCMGAGLPIAFSMGSLTLDWIGFSLIAFLTLGPMMAGIWMFWLGYKRRVRFDPRVSIIRGILTIRKKRVPSNTGGVSYVNEYYIGNALLHGPPGSYYLLEKCHGRVIDVHALFLRMYPPLNLSKRYEGIEEALLFNLNDQIDLNGAFEKYGRKMFKRDAWRFNLLSGPPMLLCLGLGFYLIFKYEIFTFWALMGIVVASIIAGGLIYALLEYLYKKLRKGLDADYVDLTLEEMLKG
ncbi:hypothetical protein [Vreelandella sp. EE7]